MVIRATLDAFWSCAPGTLSGHISEIKFQIKYGRAEVIQTLIPLGPWPLCEDLGMQEAISLECQLLEKGTRGRDVVTYLTDHKARSMHTNLWTASPLSGGDITFSLSGKSRLFATRSPSQSQWV